MRALVAISLALLMIISPLRAEQSSAAEQTTSSKMEKIERLMVAQGILQIFQQQRDMGKAQAEEISDKLLAQLLNEFPSMPEQFQDAIDSAFDKFVLACEGPWSTEHLVATWAKYYGDGLTDSELSVILTYYESPIGQKDIAASQRAMQQFSQHFATESQALMQQATADYIAELKAIVTAARNASNQ